MITKLKENLFSDFVGRGYTQSAIERYLDGLTVVLNRIDRDNKDSFYDLLFNYYRVVKLEKLLTLEQVERLYRAYKNNDSLIIYILKVFEESKKEIIKNSNFQLLIINNCFYHPKDKFMFQYNLLLFMKMIDFLKIDHRNFDFYRSLLETIMKMNLENNFRESKSKLNFRNHYSYLLYQYQKFQKENRSIVSYIQLLKQCYNKHQNFPTGFLAILDERLPKDYMFQLSQRDLNILNSIYTLNPKCYDKLIMMEGKISVSNILIPVLEAYGISELFYKKFLKIDHYKKLNQDEKLWFETIVKGKNLVYADNLPFKITKKQAHAFSKQKFKKNLTIKEGLIFSVLVSKGCSEKFAMTATNRISNFDILDDWIEIVEILNHKGIGVLDFMDVVDYLYHQIVVLRRTNIDLRNKTTENLLEETNRWHLELRNRKIITKNSEFEQSQEIKDFNFNYENQEYIIIQLTNTEQLFNEGEELNHCVVSYNQKCINQECQIFSLRIKDDSNFKSLITIEIVDNVIFQIRGFKNRNCNETENMIILKWAEQNKIEI
jgi:hypothetical protein